MNQLSPLERRIKAAALWTIRRVKPETIETTTNKISFISKCDCVFDIVTYDKQTKQYTVQYDKWVDRKKKKGQKIKTFELTFKIDL